MTRTRFLFAFLTLAASAAAAQQLYRWTDENGRTHVTDTPPPASARGIIQRKGSSNSGAEKSAEAESSSFELTQALKSFPVVLFTAPACEEPCAQARNALNKRAVPFKEVQVWNDASLEELKRASGGDMIPTLLVGRSVQAGFEQGAFDALLDSARYPKAGILPARAQAAPAAPEGYLPPEKRPAPPKAEPVEAAADERPSGPYSPGSRPRPPTQKK